MRTSVLAGMALCVLVGEAYGGGWPTHRADAGRTGYTPNALPAGVSLRWVYRSAHAPAPAWPNEPRMSFDHAYHVVSDGTTVYFGSSADGKVYALDAASGKERWAFFTGAPVRFAPTLWKDRVFAVSDDGYLYCLSAKDGAVVWKKGGAPSDRMVLGNERMVSKWPARGGPVVVDGVVYFGAGIWPADGIFIHALDAGTGTPIWVNDTSGSIRTGQPHRGGVRNNSAVSCQGYLAAGGDRLFAPTGRSVPAAFNRADGALLYYHLGRYGDANGGAFGGTAAALVDSLLFGGDIVFDATNGARIKPLGAVHSATVAADPTRVFYAYPRSGGVRVVAFDRARPLLDRDVDDKKGKRTVKVRNGVWQLDAQAVKGKRVSLIVAGRAVVLGGSGSVGAFDIETRKLTWTGKVDGTALGMAVAGGRLFVSTDKGAVYCFGAGKGEVAITENRPLTDPYPDNEMYVAAAEEIIRATGIKEGYCLDLGCGEGRLAFELAKRANLRIYGIEKDPAKVAVAREKLDAAGLYGVQVTVHQGDPAGTIYPNYFANLVVSGNSVVGGAVHEKEMSRLQRPYGGAACIGKPGAMKKTVRGPMEGAGQWTHQYADPGNTVCSDDALIKGPLTVLWFGGPDQAMPNRHGRGPAPLLASGRLYVQGVNDVRAVDVYNGRVIWELPLKGVGAAYSSGRLIAGVGATGGNMCVGEAGLYVRTADHCLRIDGATGKELGTFKAPPGKDGSPGTWGYIACDGGLLFGSRVDTRRRRAYSRGSRPPALDSQSTSAFALDAATGRLKWQYRARQSIRHNAIAVGGGSVYLIDRLPAPAVAVRGKAGKGERLPERSTGALLALDAATGRVRWTRTEDILGTMLALSVKHGIVLMSGGRQRLAAFRVSDGAPLYDVEAFFAGHPVVNGRTVYGAPNHYRSPGAWDLLTGKAKRERMTGRGSCGMLAGGTHILTFRAGSLGYVDLRRPGVVENFGGVRPGCWINAIPAGGLVLMPDASDGCRCSYQMKTSLALEPRDSGR